MTSQTSRREFLSAGLSAGAAVPLAAAIPAKLLLSEEKQLAKPGSAPKLQYRTLGRTGLKVTTVGMGCMITSDPSVVARALDAGINYFDTARGYQHGNNERMVGTVLGTKRKQVFVSTKTHSSAKREMQQDLEQSLRELNTDYIDIWCLHGRDDPSQITDEMIEVQQAAKQQGKIRFAAISTHGGQQKLIPWMAQRGAFDVVIASYNFTMDATMDQAIETAAKAGIGVVAMKVMAGGSRRAQPGSPLAGKLGSPGTLLAALKWVVNKPGVATTIPSITDNDQLEENLKAMDAPYSSSDAKILAAHLERIAPLYCRMCGSCDGTCRNGLSVADMLRCLNYADGYGQFTLGRESFLELAAEHRHIRCADCNGCSVSCPNGVRVRELAKYAQELFA